MTRSRFPAPRTAPPYDVPLPDDLVPPTDGEETTTDDLISEAFEEYQDEGSFMDD